jgi:hypothetical protein
MADSLVFWTDVDGDKDKLIREFVIGKGTALLKRWNKMEHLFPFWLFGALKLVLWHSSLIFAGFFKARTQATIESYDEILYPKVLREAQQFSRTFGLYHITAII